MRKLLVFAAVMGLSAWGVWAQDDRLAPTDNAQLQPGRAGDAGLEIEATPGEPPAGDTVILRDGRRLEGVQVLRITGTDYEIQVVEGGAPMSLPRSIVREVEWDDYDPPGVGMGRTRIPATTAPEPVSSPSSEELTRDEDGNIEIVRGVKAPEQLVAKLRRDISREAAEFAGKELFEVLKTIGDKVQLRIVPDQPVRELVRELEGMTVEAVELLEPPLTVAQFFHNHLLKQPAMRGLDIVYMPDRLILTTREAAQRMRAEMDDSDAGPGAGS